ncbi:MAG TPA: hypothetical protein PK514_10225 [Spirochaetota bacterium]|nr:hypothetical protein [Spirochaetota bacterium]
MESLVNKILSDKTVLILVLLVLSLIIYFILKRLVKLIIIAIIMLVLFTGYMYYKGEKIPKPLMQIIEEGKKTRDSINMIGNTVETITKTGKEKVQSSGSSRGSSSE